MLVAKARARRERGGLHQSSRAVQLRETWSSVGGRSTKQRKAIRQELCDLYPSPNRLFLTPSALVRLDAPPPARTPNHRLGDSISTPWRHHRGGTRSTR